MRTQLMLLNVLYNLNYSTGLLSIQQMYALVGFIYQWCRNLTSKKSLFPSAVGCDFWGCPTILCCSKHPKVHLHMTGHNQVHPAQIKSPSYSVYISGFLVFNFLHQEFKGLAGTS